MCMYVQVRVWAPVELRSSEEGTGFPGGTVTDSCEPSQVWMEKDQALLTTETSFQPPEDCNDTFYELNYSSCFVVKKTMDTYMKFQLYK